MSSTILTLHIQAHCRLPLRLAFRASAQPQGEGSALGDRTAACDKCQAKRRKLSAALYSELCLAVPGIGPYAPLRDAPGAPRGRLESRRGVGGKTSWLGRWVRVPSPIHHHHQQQEQHKRQLNATSLSIHTTQDAALARDLSFSLARSRAGSRAAAQPACRATPTRTQRGLRAERAIRTDRKS